MSLIQRRRPHGLGMFVLAMTLLVTAGGRAQAAQPVPDDAAQAATLKQIQSIYEAEYDQRDNEGRQQLARLLFRQWRETHDDPTARYVLLREARDLAALAGDADFTYRIMETMVGQYEVDSITMSLDVLPVLARSVRTPEQNQTLVKRAMMSVDDAVQQNRYDDALRLLPIIRSAAVKARDRDLNDRVTDLTRRLNTLKVEYQKLAEAVQTLETQPDDPKANMAIGRFYAFTEGSWDKALPHLQKSDDATWQSLAESDLAKPGDAKMQAELGDIYWQQAEDAKDNDQRTALYQRARHWYRQALPNLQGLTRTVVADRAAGDDAIDLGTMKLLPGLVASYYNGYRFERKAETVIDQTVNHDWGLRSPRRGMHVDFGVRWVGWLEAPESGWYELAVTADDWAKVIVDEQLALEARQTGRARVYLIKGFNAIQISFIDYGGPASLTLKWQPPGASEPRPIPSSAFFYDMARAAEATK